MVAPILILTLFPIWQLQDIITLSCIITPSLILLVCSILFRNKDKILTFIDESESNVTIHEIGYPDTEIKIQDKYTIKFIADEDLEQYNRDDEDTSLDDFDFED